MKINFPLPYLIYTDSDNFWYTNKAFTYILWFQPSLGYILFWEKEVFIFLDARYIACLWNWTKKSIKKQISYDWKIHFKLLSWDIKKELISLLPHKKLFVDMSISLSFFEELENFWLSISWTKDFFQEKRLIKSQEEKEKIKKAINIIENVWEEIVVMNKEWLLIWKTELWIRWYIVKKIFELWWESESFDTVVAFWENSAIPHHSSGNTVIWNWPLLVDMGAYFEGYASDFTRTLWVGEKTDLYEEFLFIQNLVEWAYQEAKKAVRVWENACFIDKKARDFLSDAWYGDFFTHSTWHWVGLDIHEKPSISEKSLDILKEWMVFTIEPWLYFPWKFWVRYENIIII